MWLLGHTALAYLVVKIYAHAQERQLAVNVIVFVFVFANIIDAIHIGILRIWGHNLIGTFIFAFCWLFFFGKCSLIKKEEYDLLILATIMHIVGDLLFSGYYLFWPIIKTSWSLLSFNSMEHLVTEALLAILFFIVFLRAEEGRRWKQFMVQQKREFLNNFSIQKLFQPSFYPFYLIILFSVFAYAQVLYSIVTNMFPLLFGQWYTWMFIILFMSFIIILVSPLFNGNEDGSFRS